MLPSGFEPESKPREGFMIGHYTTGANKTFLIFFYPPEATRTATSSPSFSSTAVIGTGGDPRNTT